MVNYFEFQGIKERLVLFLFSKDFVNIAVIEQTNLLKEEILEQNWGLLKIFEVFIYCICHS